MRPRNLRHVRDAAAGLGEGTAPQQQVPPGSNACLAHAKPCWVQSSSLGEQGRYWGKTPWEGRAASTGMVVPTPSQHSGMVRNRVDEAAQAGWAEHGVLAWGTAVQQAGAKQSSALAQPLTSIYSEAPALR